MAHIFKKPIDSDRNIATSLYFGNLDPQVTETLLYELFVQFAPIKSLNLPKDRLLKSHQGFGFVEFRNVEDADYTLEILRGVRLFGRALKLKRAEQNKGPPQPHVGTTKTNTVYETNILDVGAKVFINNLNPLIDEKFLNDTFSKFGKIIKPPTIIRDENGESKGYGFLSFDDFSSSDFVIEKMNGVILMNSKISISYAYKEDPNTGQRLNIKHGDKVERLLAESAKMNKIFPSNPLTTSQNSSIDKTKKTNKVTKPKPKKGKK